MSAIKISLVFEIDGKSISIGDPDEAVKAIDLHKETIDEIMSRSLSLLAGFDVEHYELVNRVMERLVQIFVYVDNMRGKYRASVAMENPS